MELWFHAKNYFIFKISRKGTKKDKNKFRSPYLICLQNLPSISFGSHQRYTYSTLTIMPKTFPKIFRDSPSKWLLARSAVPKGKRPPVFLFNSWMAMASYELLVVYRLYKWGFGFLTVNFLCYQYMNKYCGAYIVSDVALIVKHRVPRPSPKWPSPKAEN